MKNELKLDLEANRGNLKSLIFIVLFRLSYYCAKNKIRRIIGFPIRLFYRIFSRNILNLEIWDTTIIGTGFTIYHGAHGSVINAHTCIGRNVSLRQNTTIGAKEFNGSGNAPVIDDFVTIGPNVCIIGNVHIGKGVVIGAGTVVVNDIPAYAVVVGNPAKIIKYQSDMVEIGI